MGNPAARDDQARAAVALRRRILVVDDEASIREVLTQYLELEGFTVLQAADGEEALRSAEPQPTDLVVLALMLAGMDGFVDCRRLSATSVVPILQITARSDETIQLA